MSCTVEFDVADYVRRLERAAVSDKGVAVSVAARAGRATRLAFGAARSDRELTARAKAYFWTTVRRLVSKDTTSGEAKARFLLSALVADLHESGRTREAIWDEIELGWAQRFPAHVVDELRGGQCA